MAIVAYIALLFGWQGLVYRAGDGYLAIGYGAAKVVYGTALLFGQRSVGRAVYGGTARAVRTECLNADNLGGDALYAFGRARGWLDVEDELSLRFVG